MSFFLSHKWSLSMGPRMDTTTTDAVVWHVVKHGVPTTIFIDAKN